MKFFSMHTKIVAFSLLVLVASTNHAAENFAACLQFFANNKPPVVALKETDRALWGAFKQTTEKSHRIFRKALSCLGFSRI